MITISTTVAEHLKKMGACSEAVAYSENYDTAEEAWKSCLRGDWMLWIITKINKSNPWSEGRKKILGICLDCAETVHPLIHQCSRGHDEIRVLRRWVSGEVDVEEAIQARNRLYETNYANVPACKEQFMRIYLASRYGRIEQLRIVRKRLCDLGHVATSRWLDTERARVSDWGSLIDCRAKHALIDLDDVLTADCVISFTEEPGSVNGKRGGRHVEFGVALQAGKEASRCRMAGECLSLSPKSRVFRGCGISIGSYEPRK